MLLRRALLHLPRGVITLALVSRLFDEWWSYLPAGAIGDLRADLGLTYAQAGWVLATMWIGALAGAPLGALADHFPRRPLAVGGAATLAVGLVPFALEAPFAVLVVSSFGLGAASDLVLRPLEASLEEVSGDRLERLLGRQHVITWAGDLIGPALLAIGASTAFGWQGAFAVTAAALLVYAAVLAVTEFPPPPRRAVGARHAWRETVQLARRRDVVLLAAGEFVLGPLDEPLLGFAVARLVAEGRGGVSQVLAVGIFVGGLAGSGLVSVAGLTPAVRRSGPALMVVGTAGTAPSWPLLITLVALTLVGLGMALTWATLHHRMLIAEEGRSATVSGIVSVLATPAALVPVAIGAMADRTSLTVGLWCYAALAIPTIVLLPMIDRSRSAQRAE